MRVHPHVVRQCCWEEEPDAISPEHETRLEQEEASQHQSALDAVPSLPPPTLTNPQGPRVLSRPAVTTAKALHGHRPAAGLRGSHAGLPRSSPLVLLSLLPPRSTFIISHCHRFAISCAVLVPCTDTVLCRHGPFWSVLLASGHVNCSVYLLLSGLPGERGNRPRGAPARSAPRLPRAAPGTTAQERDSGPDDYTLSQPPMSARSRRMINLIK